jgi:hypothetical protein
VLTRLPIDANDVQDINARARLDHSVEMSLIAVDVDGTLANPVMALAVVLWAVILAVPLTRVGIRSSWTIRVRLVSMTAIVLSSCLITPFINRAMAMAIYVLITKPGVSVGFFGGPPFFASPVLAFVLTMIAIGTIQAVRRLRRA